MENTRTDITDPYSPTYGKKVLFIEELQSDWGQKGKKEGFDNVDRQSAVNKAEKELKILEDKLDEIYERKRK